ncbi:MAG: hypothetical protein H6538_03335 [Bacteroidales bacterium]|nr:hypothetical protein [Bacteroidales bacterium]MCB8999356.1 hypothetical protein [Bacteroidales bacterium]MCB9013401.1 hypothetical protein [Bacteroidales bacterium]
METFRNLVVTIVVLFMSIPGLHAQDKFTVIKVTGNIVIKRTGSPLDIGTAFNQDENLSFNNSASRAAVINPQRGRYLLTADNAADFRSSKSEFLPPANKISSRGIGLILSVNDLKNYFEGSFVILDEIKIKLDPQIFPMNEKKYFYIRYNYKNETINKKLGFSNDTLIISRNELFTIDGKQIPNPEISEMKLMYMEEGLNYVSTPICSFTPVFPDEQELKKEVGIILKQTSSRTFKDKLNEVSAFITEFYGKPDLDNLKNWLSSNFSPEELN